MRNYRSAEHPRVLQRHMVSGPQSRRKGLLQASYSKDEVSEVSEVVVSRHRVAMQRFPVQQGTKVRPVDDGPPVGSSANAFSCMTERLSVPSIDQMIAVSRTLRTASCVPLAGWVVDDASAFRQMAVSPCSRRVAVVGLCHPDTGRVRRHVVDCHPASVFNFNRRCGAHFILDAGPPGRFGLTGCELAQEECDKVVEVCKLWGVAVSPKSQSGQALVLLGISFLFKERK